MFAVTQNHIALAKKLNIGWIDWAYDGAPGVDPKRPFGNSQPVLDIAEIVAGADQDDAPERFRYDREGDLTHVLDQTGMWRTPEELMRLFRDMETVLQILVSTLSLEVGFYRKTSLYGVEWERVPETDVVS